MDDPVAPAIAISPESLGINGVQEPLGIAITTSTKDTVTITTARGRPTAGNPSLADS